jgi:hypothetical protein
MLRSFTVIDPYLVNLIRENPRYTKMTPEEICRGGNSPAGWQNALALNPKMRRGLIILPVYWKVEEHTRTREF